MRIAIFGLGAVGGFIAGRLAAGGHDVSAVARGPTLAVLRDRGLTLRVAGETETVRIRASESAAELGPQDLVISTAKATAPTALAKGLAPLLGPATPVVFAQNGIPWWYGIGLSPSRPRPPDLSHLDPEGALRSTIAPERVIGAVIQSSNEMVEPGVVQNESPKLNALLVGEADDSQSERITALRKLLEAARISSPPVPDIRLAIWRKLMVNASASVLCLITGRRLPIVKEDAYIGDLFERAARDVIAAAGAHGMDLTAFDPVAFRQGPQNHMPSIRQDYDRGRAMEIDAIVMAPVVFARAAGLETPSLDAIAAIARRMAIERGLYAG
jgi:2-dehydropantoate 2-reductase